MNHKDEDKFKPDRDPGCGCGFGTTPKALANMEALTNRYIPSPKAFFIIPLVGGLFIDFFNVAIITFFINVLS